MNHSVWYVAYGSNLSTERFGYYLDGGTPPGASHRYPGARDRRRWGWAELAECRKPVYFAGNSTTWGGGVAFLGPRTDPACRTLVRVYSLTHQQFEDVVAQENWIDPGDLVLDAEMLATPGAHVVARGLYGTVVSWGVANGAPIVAVSGEPGPPCAPTVAYLRHIASGLQACFELDDVVRYLCRMPGAAGAYDPGELYVELAKRMP